MFLYFQPDWLFYEIYSCLSIKKVTNKVNDFGTIEPLTSDTEGGTNTLAFIRALNQHKIRHIQNSTTTGMVERAITTIQNLIHKIYNPTQLVTFFNKNINPEIY